MKARGMTTITALLALSALAGAQSLSVTNSPVPPGGTASILLTNSGPSASSFFQSPTPLHVMQPTGELVFPFTQPSSQVLYISPGSQTTLSLPVPLSGPGSSGTYVLHYKDGQEAVARIDIGGSTENFPRIHIWPSNMHDFWTAHSVLSMPFGLGVMKIANTGPTDHTFTGSDALYVFKATLSSPVRNLPLRGVTVPAGGVVKLDLDLSGMTSGPFRVMGVWQDPDTQQIEVVEHGLRLMGSKVDMHLPGGKRIKKGEPLPVVLALRTFPAPVLNPPAGVPIYFIGLSSSSGLTQINLGFNALLPLTDPLVQLSFNSGVFGILQNNIGQAAPVVTPVTPVYNGTSIASLCTITHPGFSFLAGRSYYLAAVAMDPLSGVWGASQQEVVTFE